MVVVVQCPLVQVDDAILADILYPVDQLRDVVTKLLEVGDDLLEGRALEVRPCEYLPLPA